MRSNWSDLRQKRYLGVSELAACAASLISELELDQERGSVSETPNERTMRYYLTEGLLAPPIERSGTSQVFGYLHLLQVLAIKKLQSAHLTLRNVKEVLKQSGESELEKIIGVNTRSGRPTQTNQREAARDYLMSLIAPRAASHADLRFDALRDLPAMLRPASVALWRRLEIEPGLELHIRQDFTPASDPRGTQRTLRRIQRELDNLKRNDQGEK